ncbi:unnamed protein product, partial [Ilex paraguariensis]
ESVLCQRALGGAIPCQSTYAKAGSYQLAVAQLTTANQQVAWPLPTGRWLGKVLACSCLAHKHKVPVGIVEIVAFATWHEEKVSLANRHVEDLSLDSQHAQKLAVANWQMVQLATTSQQVA